MLKDLPSLRSNDGPPPANGTGIAVWNSRGISYSYKKGDLLFVEGDDERGAFVVTNGCVKLSTTLSDGRPVIVYIAGSGSILGLNAVIGRCEHEVTAEAIAATNVSFMRSEQVRALLHRDPEFARRAADEMAKRYRAAHSIVCMLARSEPILVKLARLVSDWLSDAETERTQIENTFTHQQIAEMLGTTRETVTRAFRHLRECEILTLKRNSLEVHDVRRLRLLADGL